MVLLRDWTDSFAVNSLDACAERFFARLLMKADDYGRFHADPAILKSVMFPLQPNVRNTDISRWLAACQKAGLLRSYHDSSGRALIEVKKFGQRKKFMKADFPPPDGQGQLPLKEEKRREEKRTTKTTKPIEASAKGGTGGNNGHLPLSSALSALALRFERALGPEWVNDAGKWVNRIKAAAARCERVVAEVESAIKESRIKKTPAAYAEFIWQEFK